MAARCRRAGVPCLALCGSVGDGAEILYGQGITAIFSAVRGAADFAAIQRRAGKDLEFLTEAAIRLFLAGGGRHAMTVYLIRHGQTQGNLERRYIGSTDQPLCPQGREALEGREMPSVDGLYVSPLLRCRQTAAILFTLR